MSINRVSGPKSMTVREALQFGVGELAKSHTHDPEGCAKFLLRHALEKTDDKRLSTIDLELLLITDPDAVLPWSLVDSYKLMVRRRAAHEPAWYITNEAYFWQDTFYVDGRVLIPRPETEILVEKVLGWIKERSGISEQRTAATRIADRRSQFSIVDVGTGCGCIAISLAEELTGLVPVTMYASDISADAIEVAKMNAERLGLKAKIRFLVGDGLEPPQEPVDLIVGNPPYVPTETVGGLSYDIHHFEPRVALDGGADGLNVHRKILATAKQKLRKHGAIFLEIGHDQGLLASKIARENFPEAQVEITKDYEGNDRILSIKT